MLGQVGLEYEITSSDLGGRVLIFERSHRQSAEDVWAQRAREALRRAAELGDDGIAAEASYMLAKRDQDEGRHWMRSTRSSLMVEQYDDLAGERIDALPWVRKAMLAIGESMTALGQHREAFNVYLNYRSKAEDDDPELPRALLAAAVVGARAVSESDGERGYIDRATELLQLLVSTYGPDKRHEVAVNKARLQLGDVLFEKQAYAEAETYYRDFGKTIRGENDCSPGAWRNATTNSGRGEAQQRSGRRARSAQERPAEVRRTAAWPSNARTRIRWWSMMISTAGRCIGSDWLISPAEARLRRGAVRLHAGERRIHRRRHRSGGRHRHRALLRRTRCEREFAEQLTELRGKGPS